MASFKIHIDTENQISQVRNLKNQGTKKLHTQKRSVLGTIHTNSTIENHSQKPLKQDEKKCFKPTKPAFTIQEDELEEGARAVLQAIAEDKAKKEVLETNKAVVAQETCKEIDLPAIVTDLPQQPIREIPCLETKELSDEKMSESSFNYNEEECPMSLDKSLVCQNLKAGSQSREAIYDLEEYREDIFKYLLQIEDRNRPKAYYMRRQPDVTYSMRTILVDWLVEVGQEYHLHTETLHIAVYIIDRFLSLMSVIRGKLQLLGTAAMFIASKYEEIYPPEVSEFVYITDETYTKRQMLRMEHLILKVLMFDISVPTRFTFIQIICISCGQSEKIKQLAVFLSELALLEGDPYLSYLPSVIASATIALARFCLEEEEPWPTTLAKFTGYSLDKLAPVIGYLNDTHAKSKSIQYQSIQEKYKSKKYQSVAEIEHKQFIVIPSQSEL